MQMALISTNCFRCEDFFNSCTVSFEPNLPCCGGLFPSRPILFLNGLCFVSKTVKKAKTLSKLFDYIFIDAKVDKNISSGNRNRLLGIKICSG